MGNISIITAVNILFYVILNCDSGCLFNLFARLVQ